VIDARKKPHHAEELR